MLGSRTTQREAGKGRAIAQILGGAFVALSVWALPHNASAQGSDLVFTQRGTLPILLTAPHGGTQAVPGVPERTTGTRSGDFGTFEITQQVAAEIERRLGGRPYVVAARFDRKFIDANRAEAQAYEDPDAEIHYDAYHAAIAGFVAEIDAAYPDGSLMLDIHGQSKFPAQIHRGTRNGLSVTRMRNDDGDQALIGATSVFGALADQGYDVFPDGTPIGNPNEDSDLNGAFSVTNYGSHNAGGIDVIQVEIGRDFRAETERADTAAALGEAIAVFTRSWNDYAITLLTQPVLGKADESFDGFGRAVATGDFDGDGRDDLAAGVPGEDFGGTNDPGTVSVLYGSAGGLAAPRSEDLTQERAGATSETGDRFGAALAAGDFNRDGYDDLAVGAPSEDYDGATDAGNVSIFLGSPSGLLPARWERFGQESAGGAAESGDRFGATLAAGDLDGDGYDDLAVGVPGEDYDGASDAGIVAVFFGSSAGLLPASWERFGQESAGAGVESGDGFGSALAIADFDRDGRDDLAVGIPGEDYDGASDAGIVAVFFGSSAGLLPARFERFGQEATGAAVESGDRFGAALAAGDFDRDGYADLAVGLPGEDYDTGTDAGLVAVHFGSPAGLLPVRFERFGQEVSGAAVENDDRFGQALAAGDFDGDGYDDLAVGVPGEDVGAAFDCGMVVSLRGSSAGLVPARSQRLGQTGIGGSDEFGDVFGAALAAGDFDGDGRSELAVAAPDEEVRGSLWSGAVYVFRGIASGLGVRP